MICVNAVGDGDGRGVGLVVGVPVGADVGTAVGADVGSRVGAEEVGADVGAREPAVSVHVAVMDTAPYPEAQPAHRTTSLPSVGAATVLSSVVVRAPEHEPESNEPPETSMTQLFAVSSMRAVSDAPDVYVPPHEAAPYPDPFHVVTMGKVVGSVYAPVCQCDDLDCLC